MRAYAGRRSASSVRDATDDDAARRGARAHARPALAGRAAAAAASRARCARPPRRASPCGSRSTARAACASQTGAGLYDHFLEQLAFHAGLRPRRRRRRRPRDRRPPHRRGRGARVRRGARPALGDRRGIARYGDAVVPMDDALARAAVDLGGRPHAELKLEHDPGMAGAHAREPRAGGARGDPRRGDRPRRAPRRRGGVQGGRPRAARSARARRGRRAPVDEGRCCEGRDLRVRRGQRPLGRARVRAGSAPSSSTTSRGADLAVLPGVGSARAAMDGLRERGHDVALRERVAAGRPGARHLPRPAARARRRPRRTAASTGLGLAARPRRTACSEGRVPRMGWAEVDERGAFYFAHSYAAETPRATALVGGRRRGGARRARSSACQFHPEKSGARGRALSSRRRDASPAPDPVPRRRRRARRQRRALPGAARRRRPGRARRRVLGRGRRRARLPRHQGDARRARRRSSSSCAASPSGSRSRSRSAAASARSPTPTRCSQAGADKVGVNSAALARPELITELAERLGSQAVVVAIDAEGGRVRSRAGTTRDRARRGRVGARGARSAARARSC